MIKGYLDGIEGGLRGVLEGRKGPTKVDGSGSNKNNNRSNENGNVVRDMMDALRGIRYLLLDVHMAWDFSTPWADGPPSSPCLELNTNSVFLVKIWLVFLGIYQTNTRGKLGWYRSVL